jgi:hypothetical protein
MEEIEQALRRNEQKRTKKLEKTDHEIQNDFQNDMFYFIAVDTSGGALYGVIWEEIGLEPYEELD